MIKTCHQCNKPFEVTDTLFDIKKFCNDRCRNRASKFRKYLHEHFDENFTAWKRDFAAAKTKSNL